jgi:rhamnosyltransferase
VVLASYNGGQFIGEQLDSIVTQHDVNLKVFVFDDCSTDCTEKIVNGFRDKVTFVPADYNSGGAGSNFLRALQSDLIDVNDYDCFAFSDQDDIWLPHKLSKCYKFMKRSGADLVSSAVCVLDGVSRSRKIVLSQKAKTTEYDFLFEGAGQGCTFLFLPPLLNLLRDVMVRHPVLVSRVHYHDWLLYCVCRCHDMQWRFFSEPTMHYRQHALNDTGSKKSIAGFSSRFKKIRSGWYRDQVLTIMTLAANDNDQYRIVLDTFTGHRTLKKLRIGLRSRRKVSDRLMVLFSILMGYM